MSEQTTNATEFDKFTTDDQREILFYLHQLIVDGEPVKVSFNAGKDMFLTVLLALDKNRNRLIFDRSGSEDANRALLNSGRNIFTCAPHGVKNQFSTGAAGEVSYQQRRAFATALPASYVRLQRRGVFRLVLPFTQRPLCTVPLGNGATQKLAVFDISIGGVALELPADQPPFAIGQKLARAHISLAVGNHLHVDLEVSNVHEIERGNQMVRRIGCRFIAPSSAVEIQLQRYISAVQREERARLGS